MGGSHPYANGEGGFLGLRPPTEPWKGILACSQCQEQVTPLGWASSPAPRGAPFPEQVHGLRAPELGATPCPRARPGTSTATTDVQVSFTLITVPTVYPLPVGSPDTASPQQLKKPPPQWSL